MLLYILKRLATMLLVAIGVSIVCFSLVHLAPGDPLTAILPSDASLELQNQMRAAYGFDKPLPVQYALWLWKALHGDLGTSLATGRPVLSEVGRAVGNSLILASVSTLIGFIVLSGLRWFEGRVERYQRGELHVGVSGNGLSVPALRRILEPHRIHVKSVAMMRSMSTDSNSFDLDVRWPSEKGNAGVPAVLAELEQLPGLTELRWKGISTRPD